MSIAIAMIPIICSLGLFALIATIWLGVLSRDKFRVRMDAELRMKFLERNAVASDDASVQRVVIAETRIALRDQILSSIRTGSVLVFLGGAFWILSRTEDRDFRILALIVGAAGAGYWVATLVMMAVSRGWLSGMTSES